MYNFWGSNVKKRPKVTVKRKKQTKINLKSIDFEIQAHDLNTMFVKEGLTYFCTDFHLVPGDNVLYSPFRNVV